MPAITLKKNDEISVANGGTVRILRCRSGKVTIYVRGDFARVVVNGSRPPAPNDPPYVRHHHNES